MGALGSWAGWVEGDGCCGLVGWVDSLLFRGGSKGLYWGPAVSSGGLLLVCWWSVVGPGRKRLVGAGGRWWPLATPLHLPAKPAVAPA
eukprot:246629-Chlamydomonas_euryale.AAC.3